MTEIELIKTIREKTSLPLKDIKKAIESVGNDEDAVVKFLREQGTLKSQTRSDRATTQGGVFTYNHENRLAVVVVIKCETDFVARSDSFKNLGNDLALHAAAYRPQTYNKSDVEESFIEKELEIAKNQLINEGKNEDIIAKILTGKKSKILEDVAMESQPFLKDPSITVENYVNQVSQETGEKIIVGTLNIFELN
jgi:elongation factor Ts